MIQGLKSVTISDSQEVMKKINGISSKNGIIIQVCNASGIATWEHIFFSSLFAMLAFNQQRNISKQLGMEILLYISGQRQIKIALETFGLQSGNNAVIILGNSKEILSQSLKDCETIIGGVASDDVMGCRDASKGLTIQKTFHISDEELNAINPKKSKEAYEQAIFKAVINRVALVALEK